MRLAVLVAAQVLSVANANLIAVALPPLSRDLSASGTQQQWIVDAFVLVFAALLIAGGVLGDRFGRRRALLAGLGLFALGSLACAVAADPGQLIAARVVQALGPPLVLPASLAIVAASYADPQARARAIGFWGAGSGFGAAVGPLIGGAVTDGLGWRWAFGFNVPLALLIAATAAIVIPNDVTRVAGGPANASQGSFDWAGGLLVTLGMAGIVFGLIEGRDRGWTSAAVLGAFAAGAALLAAFAHAERRHPAPLVDLGLLRQRVFTAANLGGGTLFFAVLGTTVYLSSYLQEFQHLTPLETGLALLPLGGAVALTSPVSGRSTARIAPRTLITAGLLCSALGAVLLSRIAPGDGPGELWPALVLLGAGVGIALPAATATAVSAVPGERTGMASAIHNASRQVGGTFGVAVLGTIVLSHAGTAAGFTDGLAAAMLVAAGALVAVAALTLALVRR